MDDNKSMNKEILADDNDARDLMGASVVIRKLVSDDEIITGKLTQEEYDRRIDF